MFSIFSGNRGRQCFNIILVRPSKYDDEGYVVRYWKGVLPSNTLATLYSLTVSALEDRRFDGIDSRVALLDDTVEDINAGKLARKYLGPNRRALVMLAGVQSNQFPRASDLAIRFKKAGFEVMLGGFHVSGTVAMFGKMLPECQALLDQGVTLVKGEVENTLGDLLEDAWRGRLQTFYDIADKPGIADAPLPRAQGRFQRRLVHPWMGTLDTSRGCPFTCSFCTVINVHGRKMRHRSSEGIVRQMEENYRRNKVAFYFFTDDNFSRNPHWAEILDGLIELREARKIPIEFMMQVDTLAWKIPRFVEKSARAGCTQVFLGIESLNGSNLKSVHKTQNAVDEIGDMVRAWHDVQVTCHAGYIIGFPHDTPESVREDVENLKRLGFDTCSFFMMTPLPGSADHLRMTREGGYMDPDLNRYDSCHETIHIPGFKPGEWQQSYHDAWEAFCNFDTVKEVLSRSTPWNYWSIFKNYMWYRNSVLERMHPMLAGLWRIKPRLDRRDGFAPESRWRHFLRRRHEWSAKIKSLVELLLELQELWLQTRLRPVPVQERMEQWRKDCGGYFTRIIDAGVVRWNATGRQRYLNTREHLNAYWLQFNEWVRGLRVFRLMIETPRIAMNLERELRLGFTFLIFFLHELNIPRKYLKKDA